MGIILRFLSPSVVAALRALARADATPLELLLAESILILATAKGEPVPARTLVRLGLGDQGGRKPWRRRT